MSVESRLTRDDLDELSDRAFDAADPFDVAAELVAAADAGQVADRADRGYAYLLAAEIYERGDELSRALGAADLALAAQQDDGAAAGRIRSLRAELLLRLRREPEAMAELSALRPLMTVDPLAAVYVPEALAGGGRTDLARRWVREALAEVGSDPDHPVSTELRATLDRLGEGVDRAGDDPLPDDAGRPADGEAVLLVWPEAEYELVDERWPEVLEATGADGWDDYRRRQQLLISGWDPRRHGSLWLVTGSADGFAEFLVEQGADPAHEDLVLLAQRYGDYLFDQSDPRLLPPEPGDGCWCGSVLGYSECCRPLAP